MVSDIVRMKLALSLLLVVVSLPALAQTATVTDGDTIKLNGTIYRLWGIDAPETKQACADGWPAGIEARRALEDLLKAKTVECEARGNDRFGRTIGQCRADGVDIQASMVRAGMAWAFARYSSDYVAEEKAAIEARAGVHAHNCEKAWDWRAQRR